MKNKFQKSEAISASRLMVRYETTRAPHRARKIFLKSIGVCVFFDWPQPFQHSVRTVCIDSMLCAPLEKMSDRFESNLPKFRLHHVNGTVIIALAQRLVKALSELALQT